MYICVCLFSVTAFVVAFVSVKEEEEEKKRVVGIANVGLLLFFPTFKNGFVLFQHIQPV